MRLVFLSVCDSAKRTQFSVEYDTIASITIYLLDLHTYTHIYIYTDSYIQAGRRAQKTHFHLSLKKVTGYSRSLFQKNCSVQCSRGIRLKLHRLQIYFFSDVGGLGAQADDQNNGSAGEMPLFSQHLHKKSLW